MIKRIIAFITICLIITGLFSPVFSHASAVPQPNWTDPGISEIINISDLTGWMLNGGTFDVSTYTDSESFMNDYFYGRTSTRLVDGNDLYYNQFGIGQDLYNIGSQSFNSKHDTVRLISSSFREHSGYGRRFSEQANTALLDSGNLYDMKIPLLNEVEFANFVGYNHDALRLYCEFFNSNNEITPNPDPDYLSYIDIINGSGFWFKNFEQVSIRLGTGSSSVTALIYPFSNYSWSSISQGSQYITNNNSITADGGNYIFAIPSTNILNLNINSISDTTYNISLSWERITNVAKFEWNGTIFNSIYFYPNNPNMWEGRGISSAATSINYNGSLQQCFQFISNNFRNVNIYVDGTPWAIAKQPIIPSITPEFPDAVGGEELPTSTWQVYRPRAPYYTSVPGMLQAIDDAIQGDGKLDIDDLKPYLTDENGDSVTDPVFDPEPVPIPVPDPVNPDVVPQLPELPAMPLDMPGFNGVSVLAEIINFTNQSLPNTLIITFWGIVFGIVILGLIKILHK